MSRSLRSAALVAASILAITALGPGATDAAGAATAPSGQSYVALGDSYAAGLGLSDPTGEPVPACAQTASDYPHRVARALGARLTDVTCSGATTRDLIDRRQNGAPPQVDALSAATRLVTVSIGGNDADLLGAASGCIALSRTGPVLSGDAAQNCRSTLVSGGSDRLRDAVATTAATGLREAFAAIRSKAPNALVVVVGYPAIFPAPADTPSGGCFRPVVTPESVSGTFPTNGFPFTDVDVRYLAGLQETLDAVTRTASDRAGFTYVSNLAAGSAHSACAGSDAYVAGITLTATSRLTSISLDPRSLHPTAAGAAFLADRTVAAVERATAPTSSAGPRVEMIVVRVPWLPIGLALLGAALVAATALLVARRRRRRGDSPDDAPDATR
ncbi:Lipase 2 [Frondihabitans sp. 762G35]|uniref:SGNH/GDSL hydrolase family protein n=1 Tax=Frondihabitans sp. 762G35 TaxID=1446794 RepID=UPI000D21E805|nr:SGNH/GDSL hydrolase family protein [Frondihabitans sp. 762G35]ARC56365.1 Lipase 2 [Frondihabitans sp. 762G35]